MMHWALEGHMLWMALSWIVAIVATLALFWIVASTIRTSPESPETILKRRYAAGEIDEEEFKRRSTELRQSGKAA